MAFGGDPVAATYYGGPVLKAGQGLMLAAAGRLTPIQSEDGYGLGLGLDVGLKSSSAASGYNSSVTFKRYPVALWAHALMPVASGIHFGIRAGLFKEFGVRLSSVSQPVGSSLGKQFEAGFTFPAGPVIFGLAGRYSVIDYAGDVDGNSFAVILALSWGFR